MNPFWLGVGAGLFVVLLFAAFVISRYREAARVGAQIKPMSADDRLRVVLALRMFEDAERELLKAAWINHQPGHPHVGDLVLDLKELQARARQILRG